VTAWWLLNIEISPAFNGSAGSSQNGIIFLPSKRIFSGKIPQNIQHLARRKLVVLDAFFLSYTGRK
jgi:hypothetical protein